MLVGDAVDDIAKRLGISIGAARAKLIDACRTGVIRTYWRGHYLGQKPLLPRHEWEGADIDETRDLVILANGERKGFVEVDSDYEMWLQSQTSLMTSGGAKTKRATTSGKKHDRAAQAIIALWPDGPPDQAALQNDLLHQQVLDWIKADCARRGLPYADISKDTVMRAAGRR